MKLYTYICTVGGEDEYLIAKDYQIVPEAVGMKNGRRRN